MKNLIVVIVCAVFSLNNLNAQATLRKKHFNVEYNLALQGYDPVAYFVSKKAIEGKKSLSTTFEGVIYYFSSQNNKELFLKEPEKYEPQYGGWCAYAMGASNEKVEVDPETFKLIDGKLYLFYNSWGTNTLNKWNDNQKYLNVKADKNWKSIFK